MKRKLALFMVLAMLVSLVPMNVFAASTNTSKTTPVVAKNSVFEATSPTLPILNIKEGETGQWATDMVFELELTNAEWAGPNPTATGTVNGVTGGTVTVATKSSTSAVVTVSGFTASTGSNKNAIDVSMLTKVTGGEAKVAIISRGTGVSDGTVTFATATDGATKASIATPVDSFSSSLVLKAIKIDELVQGTVTGGVKTLEFTLPANFEFVSSAVTVAGADGWVNAVSATTETITANEDNRKQTIQFDLGAVTGKRGLLYINGLKIKKTSDSVAGDVTLKIKDMASNSEFTEETIVAAKYVNYSVSVTAMADPVTIYSGRYEGVDGEDDAQKLVKMNIKEEVAGAWLADRITKIQFNDEVKILGYNIKKADEIQAANPGSITSDAGGKTLKSTGYITTKVKNKNYIEITDAQVNATKKADVEIQFYVSVKANYEGDIKATVSGDALNKSYEVVLGKAKKQASVTAELKDIKLGLKNQPIGKIVITEPDKAVWEYGTNDSKSASTTNNYLTVTLDSPFTNGMVWNTNPKVTVTKGNVTLGTITSSAGVLTIPIKVESSVAAELTLEGGTVDVDRNLPEGQYDVNVGGGAMVDNNKSDETNCTFDKGTVVSAKAVNIITPAPGDTKAIQKVVFTIDAKEYKVGDAAVQSDVAPYINEQGRTMLPLRAFANALNVSNDNIVWNETDRSVVIFKGDATIKVVIGQMSFTKNGTVVGMDTMAIIKDGRTMLPLRAVAQALGANITWDEATRTVTVQ